MLRQPISGKIGTSKPVLLHHHDLPSLLAGKAAAVLTREYVKGRDYFDVFWFLSKWPKLEPNPQMFKNALAQARDKRGNPAGFKSKPSDAIGGAVENRKAGQEMNWRMMLNRSVCEANWPAVEADVRAFIEDPDSLLVFNRENLLRLLE